MQSEKIRILQQERNNLRYVVHKHNDHSKWNQFRKKRNDVKKEIQYEKAKFYRKALSPNKPKEVWNTINSILNPPSKPISIKPDTMNIYFANIAKQTVKKDPVSPEDIEKLISQMSSNSDGFKMQKVQYSDVVKELTSLRNDTSTGSDEIPTKFIKPISDVIASPFTDIINTMIETPMFPHQWKTARVVQIPKVNYPGDTTDYRPISILPALSKIAERLILKQLLSHIEEQLLLKSTVTGYRKGHSTGTTLLKIKDDIKKAMKSEGVTLATLADFSKAFDTIAHDKVITKLHKLGFSPEFLRLI